MGVISHKAGLINRVIQINRSGFFQKLTKPHVSSPESKFEWGVAAFAVGIGLYFALPFEPNAALIVIGLAISGVLSWALRAKAYIAPLAFTVFLISLGLGRAVWHTQAAAEPILPQTRSAYTVTGWIEAVEKSSRGFRWRIRVHDMETYRDVPMPYRVRVKAKTEGFKAGDGVSLRILMTGPPGPVVPGGYDPARRAYYQKIGGYGFGISDPIAAEVAGGGMARKVARFRYALADRIVEKAPANTAGLQAALLTGVRAYIPESQTNALRAAGLAHVLAISGLHMGLLAGGAYALATFLLAHINILARRYDVRKFAAGIGIMAATAYLILSGGGVSTQRAYIMAVIVFMAVILDRRAFSIRSVALAAGITLVLHPESLISAGFQMSFAAVTALVVVYRQWDNLSAGKYGQGIVRRSLSGITTLSVTSFVAGAATGGFAILHFNRFAKYGLAGNLIAMPVFTFVVMPAALGALIVMPFGLEALPLWVMGQGLNVVLSVAEWVASWKGAVMHFSAAPYWVIGLYSLAFLWLCLGDLRLRLGAAVLTAVCIAAWVAAPRPDMRISDTGQVAFWTGDVLYVQSARADRYGREQFSQRAGRVDSEIVEYKDSLAKCDARACRASVKGKQVAIVNLPSEVPEECAKSDMVILINRRAGPVARRGCQAVLIDEGLLNTQGAQDVYLSGKTIRMTPTLTQARKRRPWAGYKYYPRVTTDMSE